MRVCEYIPSLPFSITVNWMQPSCRYPMAPSATSTSNPKSSYPLIMTPNFALSCLRLPLSPPQLQFLVLSQFGINSKHSLVSVLTGPLGLYWYSLLTDSVANCPLGKSGGGTLLKRSAFSTTEQMMHTGPSIAHGTSSGATLSGGSPTPSLSWEDVD
jgi:hypothetical protein